MTPRILMLIEAYPPEYTGAGKQLQALAHELLRLGIAVQVLTSHDGAQDIHEPGEMPVTRLASPGSRRAATFARRAFAWLRQHRRDWDLVHIHGVTRSAYAALLCARLLREPSLLKFTLLGNDDAATIRAARMGRAKLRVLACASGFIAPSQALADAAEAAGLPLSRIHPIPNGVDRTRFRPLPAAERNEARRTWMHPHGWNEEDQLVAYLGAIESRKGVDVLLDAWPKVTAQCPQARLLLAGPRPECVIAKSESSSDEAIWREEMRFARSIQPNASQSFMAQIASSLEDAFLAMTGVAIPNPESLLAAADLFCLPSRAEGLPNAALEAMACGAPCVLSRLDGITTGLFPANEANILVPPGDADALADALIRMLQDAALRSAVAEEGTKAAEKYELAGIASQYAALYDRLSNAVKKQ